MICTRCGCELKEVNSLYIHEKADYLIPGNSLSGMIHIDKAGHSCAELWFGYYKNIGAVFTCVDYPHTEGASR